MRKNDDFFTSYLVAKRVLFSKEITVNGERRSKIDRSKREKNARAALLNYSSKND